ncbi:hypothetical protein WJ970_09330 [Achromobacter xylosoxidans]
MTAFTIAPIGTCRIHTRCATPWVVTRSSCNSGETTASCTPAPRHCSRPATCSARARFPPTCSA